MDNFGKYEQMRDSGAAPQDVYRTAKADGLDPITVLRLLRRVFSLSLAQAKEATIAADGLAASLNDYQEQWIPVVEQALSESSTVNGVPASEVAMPTKKVVAPE